jgi:hypothetical protein
VVSQALVDSVATDAAKSGASIVDTLVRSNKIEENDVLGALAMEFGMQFLDISDLEINDSVRALLPGELARKFRVVPLYKQGGVLMVAMADPMNFATLDSLRSVLGKDVQGVIAPIKQIATTLAMLYPDGDIGAPAAEPPSSPSGEPRRTLVLKRLGEPQRRLVLKKPDGPRNSPVPRKPDEPQQSRPGLIRRIRSLFEAR